MRKKLGIWIGWAALLFICCITAGADEVSEDKMSRELQMLKSRLKKAAMGNPDPKNIRKIMATLAPDGSWPDLNYRDKKESGWEGGIHVRERMSSMVKAYSCPENELYKDPALREKIMQSLNFWLRNDFKNSKNAWWNLIGVPKELGAILLLFEDELSDDQIERALYIMDTELRYKKGKYQEEARYWFNGRATGQNKIWMIRIHMLKAIFRRQPEIVRECFASVAEELTFDREGRFGFNEGIQADYSFHEHGPQLTAGSYGHAFAADNAYFLALAADTSFDFSSDEKNLLIHYFLDGAQWMIYNGIFDYGAMGRSITRKGRDDRGYQFLSGVEFMLGFNTERQDDFEAFAARLRKESAPPLTGHRHFWCSDFTVHRRADYYTSVKMNSSRTMGTECGNGEGMKSCYLPDGCNFILLKGNEYNDIFAVWDWTRIPGVTCEQADEPPPIVRWGGRNEKDEPFAERGNTSFVGGVSDGTYGATVFDYQKHGISARKAWFFFDDEYVCLGAGISGTTTNPVFTSINQCLLLDSDVLLDGVKAEKSFQCLENARTVFHNGVGYLFPNAGNVWLKAEAQSGNWHSINTQYSKETVSKDVFSLWIDHGISPTNQSYCYIVQPDTDPARLAAAVENPAVEILSNTPQLQAVCNRSLGITQAVFYESGKVALPDGGFAGLDQPCLLMIRRSGSAVQISVSNPENKPLTVQVETSLKLFGPDCVYDDSRNTSVVTFNLPDGLYAGQSVVKTFHLNQPGL